MLSDKWGYEKMLTFNLLICKFYIKQGYYSRVADLVFSSAFLKSKPIYQNSGGLQ